MVRIKDELLKETGAAQVIRDSAEWYLNMHPSLRGERIGCVVPPGMT